MYPIDIQTFRPGTFVRLENVGSRVPTNFFIIEDMTIHEEAEVLHKLPIDMPDEIRSRRTTFHLRLMPQFNKTNEPDWSADIGPAAHKIQIKGFWYWVNFWSLDTTYGGAEMDLTFDPFGRS